MRGLFGPRRDDELDEEVRSHLEMAARDRMERGESSEARPAPPKDYQIIGVLPPGETFPENVDVLVPLQVDADEFAATIGGRRKARSAC